ncbi:MAG: methyltransferase family protein [bacterium JZ-2024 1]
MAPLARDYVPGLLNVITGLLVVWASLAVPPTIPLDRSLAKSLGIAIVALGMSLVVWSVVHIGPGVTVSVRPRSPRLVTTGPYAFVRHPIYLGFTIALLGTAIIGRSLPGILLLGFAFSPVEVWRAMLEERFLAEKFGTEWHRYRATTPFFIPSYRPRSRKRSSSP